MVDLVVSLRLLLRARFGAVAMWLLVTLLLVALMASQFSARQAATVTLDVGLSYIRLVLPLLAILLAQELIGREFERRYCLSSLSYPRPRHRWLLGRCGAIGLLLLVLLLAMAMLLAGIVMYVGGGYEQTTPPSLGFPYLVTLGFIVVDLTLVVAVATLFAVAATTPSFVLVGSIGFIMVARSYAGVLELLRQDSSFVAKLADPEKYQRSLSSLNFVLPDLGTLDVRMITLYGKMQLLPGDWALRLFGTVAYAVALFAVAAWVLRRRDFG